MVHYLSIWFTKLFEIGNCYWTLTFHKKEFDVINSLGHFCIDGDFCLWQFFYVNERLFESFFFFCRESERWFELLSTDVFHQILHDFTQHFQRVTVNFYLTLLGFEDNFHLLSFIIVIEPNIQYTHSFHFSNCSFISIEEKALSDPF